MPVPLQAVHGLIAAPAQLQDKSEEHKHFREEHWRKSTIVPEMDFLRVAAGFFIVFTLLGVLHYYSKRLDRLRLAPLLRKFPFRRPVQKISKHFDGESLKVLQRKILTSTHQVHLLALGNDEFLICTHPQGCTLLANKSKLAPEFSHRHTENSGECRLAN